MSRNIVRSTRPEWRLRHVSRHVVPPPFSSVPLANAMQIVTLRTPTTARVIEEVVNRLIGAPPFSSLPLAHKLRLLCLNNPRIGRLFDEAMDAVMLEAREIDAKRLEGA